MIDFEEIIKHCWTDLQYLPTFSRLRKTLHIDKKCLAFYSDAFRISIILSNILSNAVKYQNLHIDDNFVAIQILQEDEYATITIQDNGIGVEQTYIDKIFDMFFRATEKSEGSGLGMYIVQQTVERLDGNIKFQSVLGEGTTITIRIPNVQMS
jgi:signal transduction histidine kinase